MTQRILRVDPVWFGDAADPSRPFSHLDVWHDGVPWACRLRWEPRPCAQRADPRGAELPVDWLIEGGELFAGLRWESGSELRFWRDGDRVCVGGDLTP